MEEFLTIVVESASAPPWIKVRLEAGLNETDGFKRWLTTSREG
jgi:hypothetical protein